MSSARNLKQRNARRIYRVRKPIKRSKSLRLSVTRTGKHMHCQVINDTLGITLASASTSEKSFKSTQQNTWNCDASRQLGTVIALRCLAIGVSTVALDRGASRYHGRIAEFAESARQSGLIF